MDDTTTSKNEQGSKTTRVLAPRIIRLLADVEAAKDITPTGFALVSYLICRQDQFGYRRPYKAYAAQLCRELNISANTLTKIADMCVDAGWLCLKRRNSRDEAKYWVTIPDYIPEHHKEQLGDYLKICGNDHRKFCDDGDDQRSDHRKFCDPPIPSPYPKESSRPRSPLAEINGKTLKPAKFTPEDMKTAEWIWHKIHSAFPEHKPPNLKKWAEIVRLMRERDKRTHRRICEVFNWAHDNEFWRTNILSVSKLRDQFDALAAKMTTSNNQQERVEDVYKPLEKPK
ncbi:hypothetical protein [Bremerella sp. P1]|uniref:hypothetical protein n=1 Tax=Bremerella sp. P1 TaxID=3026424 RepID=UPI002368CF87|nr:hypothetical protein [Bremerella sp. P1]WDI42108.1 hypothetical protein PSR63_27010 [Bremerella sp. P1]